MENLREPEKKIQEDKFGIASSKYNTQISTVFIYTNHHLSRAVEEKTVRTIATNR